MKAIHVETDKGHWVRGGMYTTNLFPTNEEHMHPAGWKPTVTERISPAPMKKKNLGANKETFLEFFLQTNEIFPSSTCYQAAHYHLASGIKRWQLFHIFRFCVSRSSSQPYTQWVSSRDDDSDVLLSDSKWEDYNLAQCLYLSTLNGPLLNTHMSDNW